jgi:hypothetical protein
MFVAAQWGRQLPLGGNIADNSAFKKKERCASVLATLVDLGWAERIQTGFYRLTMRLAFLVSALCGQPEFRHLPAAAGQVGGRVERIPLAWPSSTAAP